PPVMASATTGPSPLSNFLKRMTAISCIPVLQMQYTKPKAASIAFVEARHAFAEGAGRVRQAPHRARPVPLVATVQRAGPAMSTSPLPPIATATSSSTVSEALPEPAILIDAV